MIEDDFERFEKCVYRNDTGTVLMRGNDDTEMLNALLFHVLEEFFRVRRLH